MHEGEAYRILIGKSKGMKPLDSHGQRWETLLKQTSKKECLTVCELEKIDAEQEPVTGSCEHCK